MDFDEIIDRTGTHCAKWDMMETTYGVSPKDGIAMWVADMDFRPPRSVQQALEAMMAHGLYGYFGDDRAYLEAICWWMRERHGRSTRNGSSPPTGSSTARHSASMPSRSRVTGWC